MKNTRQEKQNIILDAGKRFLCDCCGEEKTGKKHKIYDENWNLQGGLNECNDCFDSRLEARPTHEAGKTELA